MQRLKITDVNVAQQSIKESKELTDICQLIKKYKHIDDAIKMLPRHHWHDVSFTLSNTYSSFANAIRRVLIDEVTVVAMDVEEKDIVTNDEFILSDVLIKNINLLPINQEIDANAQYSIYLYKANDTPNIIDIKASDFRIAKHKPTDKHKNKHKHNEQNTDDDMSIDSIIPESNICIIRLRPGKFIKILSVKFQTGKNKTNAAKFSLLNNVKYEILDMKPYDPYTKTGVRSAEHDPTEFKISFTTAGNITPKLLMHNIGKDLIDRLNSCKKKITEYIKDKDNLKKITYNAEDFDVCIGPQYTTYKFYKEYITIAYMIAHRCFLIDTNVIYCSPAIDRYDNEIGIIKLNHADGNKLLIAAIDANIADVELLVGKF